MEKKEKVEKKRTGTPGETGMLKSEKRGTNYPWKSRAKIRYERHLEYLRNQAAKDAPGLSIDECLPGELLAGVFSYLPVLTLCSTIMLVSKRWMDLAKDNSLWKPIVRARFGKHAASYTEEERCWFDVCKRLFLWHWDPKVHACVKLSHGNMAAKNTIASTASSRKEKQTRMVLRVTTPIDSGIHHFALTIIKCKKANIGFGLTNRNIACATTAKGFSENNNGIGYYSVGAMFVKEGVVHLPHVDIPKFGEGDVISMLLDMEENVLRFFKWADKTGLSFQFCSSKIRIKRNKDEAMNVVCMIKGNAKVAVEYLPIASVLDKL